MEEHITKTLIESPYPFWLTILLFSVISGGIQFIISILRERGKNFATKKDISDITNKIESVKDSYNKALEAHKIELQKEFESHKYIMGLCRSLDNILLKRVSLCLKVEAEKSIEDCDNDESLLIANNMLSNFLNTYHSRYDSIPVICKLREISSNINTDYECSRFVTSSPISNVEVDTIPPQRKKHLMDCLNETLAYFIPTLIP